MQETLNRPNPNTRLAPPTEHMLQPSETYTVSGLANIPPSPAVQPAEIATGDGGTICGTEVMTIRLGSDQTYVDAKVIDVRSQPYVARTYAAKSPAPHGRPIEIRNVGYRSDGSPYELAGDFMVVIPSNDEGAQAITYAFRPGKLLTIGREHAGGDEYNGNLLPDTVSRDHCAVGIDASGNLVVENHNPTNKTTILTPAEHQVTEVMKSHTESGREISDKTAVEWLSYGDVIQDSAERVAASEWTKNSPNGLKYARELKAIVASAGIEKLTEIAGSMKVQCLKSLESMGVPTSKYSESLSWVLWDLAKQSYLAKHPEETSDDYRSPDSEVQVGDPLGEDLEGQRKRHEIVHRHIGWEVSRALDSGEMTGAEFRGIRSNYGLHLEAINQTAVRNETGQLRSYALAQLGRRALLYADLSQGPRQQL